MEELPLQFRTCWTVLTKGADESSLSLMLTLWVRCFCKNVYFFLYPQMGGMQYSIWSTFNFVRTTKLQFKTFGNVIFFNNIHIYTNRSTTTHMCLLCVFTFSVYFWEISSFVSVGGNMLKSMIPLLATWKKKFSNSENDINKNIIIRERKKNSPVSKFTVNKDYLHKGYFIHYYHVTCVR
jgi:hypothetical protein